MLDLEAVAGPAVHAVALIVNRSASVHPATIVAGVALYLLAKSVRTRAWFNILRAAFPGATGLRARDVMRAYLAGSGLNTMVPARGGDVVKLAMVHRRTAGSRYPTLAATFVPETLFESAFGAGLVVWALIKGFLPLPTTTGRVGALNVSLVTGHPALAAVGAAVAGALGWWLVRWLRAPLRDAMVILRSPRRFVTGVASWQALARLIHLGSIAAFMAAFGLPVTPSTVVLVMAAQGAGRILPVAPASAGLRVALLSYGLVAVTGHAVDVASITAFTFGVGALLTMTALAVAVAILALECGTWSPRRAVAMARTWGPGSANAARTACADVAASTPAS